MTTQRSARPESAALERVASLDGLRGFACATVFLANFHHAMGLTVAGHVGPWDVARFAESGLGVVIFVVLSGALLSIPCWRALGGGRAVRWADFALRRAARMIPAYYAALALLIVAMDPTPGTADIVRHLLFVNNFWEESFYSLSQQFWTIGMFMQFYLVLPILFLIVAWGRNRRGQAALFLVALSGACYLLHVLAMQFRAKWVVWPVTTLTDADGAVISHSTFAHLPIFILGVAAGFLLLRLAERGVADQRPATLGADAAFAISFLAAVALSSWPSADALQLPYARYLYPWLPAVVAIAIVALPASGIARRIFEFAPLRWLGVVSYGVYVFHILCMRVAVRGFASVGWDPMTMKLELAAVSAALTVAAATVSYFALERPILAVVSRRR